MSRAAALGPRPAPLKHTTSPVSLQLLHYPARPHLPTTLNSHNSHAHHPNPTTGRTGARPALSKAQPKPLCSTWSPAAHQSCIPATSPPPCQTPSPDQPRLSSFTCTVPQFYMLAMRTLVPSPTCWLCRCKACSEQGPAQALVQHLLDYAQPRPPAMAVVALHLCRIWAAAPEAACSFTPSLRRLLLYDTDVSPHPWVGSGVRTGNCLSQALLSDQAPLLPEAGPCL